MTRFLVAGIALAVALGACSAASESDEIAAPAADSASGSERPVVTVFKSPD